MLWSFGLKDNYCSKELLKNWHYSIELSVNIWKLLWCWKRTFGLRISVVKQPWILNHTRSYGAPLSVLSVSMGKMFEFWVWSLEAGCAAGQDNSTMGWLWRYWNLLLFSQKENFSNETPYIARSHSDRSGISGYAPACLELSLYTFHANSNKLQTSFCFSKKSQTRIGHCSHLQYQNELNKALPRLQESLE